MPPNQLDKLPEKKRRRKTPSHYRRDQRRLREYKSKRPRGLSPDDNSHPVEKTVHSSVQDTSMTSVQDPAPQGSYLFMIEYHLCTSFPGKAYVFKLASRAPSDPAKGLPNHAF